MDSDFDRKPSIFACSSIQTPFFEKRFLRNSRFFHGNPFFRQTLARCLWLYSSEARPVSLRDVQLEQLQHLLRLSSSPTFGIGTPPTCPPSSVFLYSCTTDVPAALGRPRAQQPRTITQLATQQTMTSVPHA